jgi:hypothetical protein
MSASAARIAFTAFGSERDLEGLLQGLELVRADDHGRRPAVAREGHPIVSFLDAVDDLRESRFLISASGKTTSDTIWSDRSGRRPARSVPAKQKSRCSRTGSGLRVDGGGGGI